MKECNFKYCHGDGDNDEIIWECDPDDYDAGLPNDPF